MKLIDLRNQKNLNAAYRNVNTEVQLILEKHNYKIGFKGFSWKEISEELRLNNEDTITCYIFAACFINVESNKRTGRLLGKTTLDEVIQQIERNSEFHALRGDFKL